MITMQDACNPDAARQTFQIENEMAAVPFGRGRVARGNFPLGLSQIRT